MNPYFNAKAWIDWFRMMPAPKEKRIETNGVELQVYDFEGEGAPILFAHATGFHARCWDEIIRSLHGRRAIAVDLRGHGRSSKPPPPYRWRLFGDDLAALLDALQLEDAIGVGHSLGGYSMALAASLRPRALRKLILIEPVILPPGAYTGPWVEAGYVAKRRNRWSSTEEMYDSFRDRAPFSFWHPGVLRDYCDYGLTPDGSGGYVLACPPEIEADVYANCTMPETAIPDEVAQVQAPALIVHSNRKVTQNFDGSPTARDLATWFAHGKDMPYSGYSHLFPMEAPDLTAQMIQSF